MKKKLFSVFGLLFISTVSIEAVTFKDMVQKGKDVLNELNQKTGFKETQKTTVTFNNKTSGAITVSGEYLQLPPRTDACPDKWQFLTLDAGGNYAQKSPSSCAIRTKFTINNQEVYLMLTANHLIVCTESLKPGNYIVDVTYKNGKYKATLAE